jgi:hypothetical protein
MSSRTQRRKVNLAFVAVGVFATLLMLPTFVFVEHWEGLMSIGAIGLICSLVAAGVACEGLDSDGG